MQAVWPSIIAVVGTLLGATLTFYFQTSAAGKTRQEARGEKRRDEFVRALSTFAAAAASLRRAEFDRAKKRIHSAADEDREAARQETYRLREEAWSAYYVLRLLGDPIVDRELISSAEQVIELTRLITAGPTNEGQLRQRSSEAVAALEALVDRANLRVRALEPGTR